MVEVLRRENWRVSQHVTCQHQPLTRTTFDHYHSTSTTAPATMAPPQATTTMAATTTTTTEVQDADAPQAPGMLFLSLFSYPTNSYLQLDYAYGTRMANTTTMPGTMKRDDHHT